MLKIASAFAETSRGDFIASCMLFAVLRSNCEFKRTTHSVRCFSYSASGRTLARKRFCDCNRNNFDLLYSPSVFQTSFQAVLFIAPWESSVELFA